MTKSEQFLAKYGHTCQEHTHIMAQEIAVMREANRLVMEDMRPGKLDPKGMVYPA